MESNRKYYPQTNPGKRLISSKSRSVGRNVSFISIATITRRKIRKFTPRQQEANKVIAITRATRRKNFSDKLYSGDGERDLYRIV